MGIFEEFRDAWRQAVDNFWEELEGESGSVPRAALREVAQVRNQLDALDEGIGHTRQRLAEEREQAEACERRERMARKIQDDETARIAAEYGARHRERAEVLSRKLDALEAERELCARDLREMEKALQDGRVAGARPELEDLNRHPREHEFQDLENANRDRSADERLEELKRRMREGG